MPVIDYNYLSKKNLANLPCSGVSTVSTCDSDGVKVADTQSQTSHAESLSAYGYDYLQKTDIPRPQAVAANKWQMKRNKFVIEALKMQQLHDKAQFTTAKDEFNCFNNINQGDCHQRDLVQPQHHVAAKKHVTFAIDFDMPQNIMPKSQPEYGYWNSSLCAKTTVFV